MKIIVSNGEIIDKYTILKIKSRKITDPAKLQNIIVELSALDDATRLIQQGLGSDLQRDILTRLIEDLETVNGLLWQVEDKIREKEHNKDFGESFVHLARNVYKFNDRRSNIKREINTLTNSTIIEEKSYNKYE